MWPVEGRQAPVGVFVHVHPLKLLESAKLGWRWRVQRSPRSANLQLRVYAFWQSELRKSGPCGGSLKPAAGSL
jgi:hypothetical protein